MSRFNNIKTLSLLIAITAGQPVMSQTSEPVSIHPEAMVVRSADLLEACASEIGANIALSNAAMEHFVSKSTRDVVRTLETCSKKHTDEHRKSLVSVAGAAVSYLGISDPKTALEIANDSERDIFGIMAPRILKSLRTNCSAENYSFECVKENSVNIDYSVSIKDLSWAKLNNEGRIVSTVEKIQEKKEAEESVVASQTLRDLKNAFYTAKRSNVKFVNENNIINELKPYLPPTFQNTDDGTVQIPNLGNKKGVISLASSSSWKFEFVASLDECKRIVKDQASLGLASMKNGGRNVPLTLSSAGNYCGPTDENNLELFF